MPVKVPDAWQVMVNTTIQWSQCLQEDLKSQLSAPATSAIDGDSDDLYTHPLFTVSPPTKSDFQIHHVLGRRGSAFAAGKFSSERWRADEKWSRRPRGMSSRRQGADCGSETQNAAVRFRLTSSAHPGPLLNLCSCPLRSDFVSGPLNAVSIIHRLEKKTMVSRLIVSSRRFLLTLRVSQSSRTEILNDGGYRSDGRRQYEIRDINIDLTPRGTADGSALITHGLTEVMVDVFGPREAKLRGQTLHDRALVSVEVGIMPFSTGERRKRSRGDKYVLCFIHRLADLPPDLVCQTHS